MTTTHQQLGLFAPAAVVITAPVVVEIDPVDLPRRRRFPLRAAGWLAKRADRKVDGWIRGRVRRPDGWEVFRLFEAQACELACLRANQRAAMRAGVDSWQAMQHRRDRNWACRVEIKRARKGAQR